MDDLVSKIENLAADADNLETTKAKAIEAVQNVFCWELEEEKLINWISNLECIQS